VITVRHRNKSKLRNTTCWIYRHAARGYSRSLESHLKVIGNSRKTLTCPTEYTTCRADNLLSVTTQVILA